MLTGISLIPIAFAFKLVLSALRGKKKSTLLEKASGEKSTETSENIGIKDIIFPCTPIH